MLLFLPNLIGNATQNYIILTIFIALFTNPISNVAYNAVESARVIGCSLTMTFEQLKERAKLIMSPIIEVLNDSKHTDLVPIKDKLKDIQQIVGAMRQEAEYTKNQSNIIPRELDSSRFTTNTNRSSQYQEIANDIQRRLNVNISATHKIVNKTHELIKGSTLELDRGKMGLKLELDTAATNDLMRASRRVVKPMDKLNLTEIMFENCLGIFRQAKKSCELSVEDMRQSCQDSVGTIFSAIFCSPFTMSLSSICPWIMDQFLDENSVCNQMRNHTTNIKLDPFGIVDPKDRDISKVYKNLTEQLMELDDVDRGTVNLDVPKRIELNIAFNNKTREIFFKINNLIKFIQDKYRIRKFFYDMFLFFYEVYTTITFLCIMLQAFRYQTNYLKQIRFDNNYITGQFISIDRKRRALGKKSVLPLTREESERYITTFTCKRRTSEERKTQKASCIAIIVFLAFIFSLLYLDDIFYSVLNSIREHAFIKFKEIGHHNLDIKVDGEGSIARLVRNLTYRLSSEYNLNRLTSTRKCLPDAQKTSNKFYVEFTYLVLIYFGIDQISIYAMRLRHVTAAFFYPDKERQRIVFLYSSILLQRHQLTRIGLESYLATTTTKDSDQNNELDQKQFMDSLDDSYTIKDAFEYIYGCVLRSLCCDRHKRKSIKIKI